MKLNDKQSIYVRSMGKLLPITAIFKDNDNANAYLAKHKDEGVIASWDDLELIFIANCYSPGLKILL